MTLELKENQSLLESQTFRHSEAKALESQSIASLEKILICKKIKQSQNKNRFLMMIMKQTQTHKKGGENDYMGSSRKAR